MRCPECNGHSSSFSEALGETVCDDCGLVLLANALEESISITLDKQYENSHLGSTLYSKNVRQIVGNRGQNLIDMYRQGDVKKTEVDLRTVNLMSMYLSSLSANSLIGVCEGYYYTLKRNRVFDNLASESRAASVVYYAMREQNIVIKLRDVARVSAESTSLISRYAKKIARFYGKSHVFTTQDPIRLGDSLLGRIPSVTNEQRETSLLFIEYMSRIYDDLDLMMSNNVLAGCIWLATAMIDDAIPQQTIVENWSASEYGLRKATRDMCQILNIDKSNIHNYDVEDIVKGIRV